MDHLTTALDSRLEQALQTSNYRLTLQNQLQLSKLKLQQQLTISLNGGTFFVDPALISFINTLTDLGHNNVVLLDVNENPVEITDLKTFLDLIVDTYYEAHNDCLLERARLRKCRTAATVVGL